MQTIKLNGWDYPVKFEDKPGYGTVAVIGHDPIVLTYQFTGGRWATGNQSPLSAEDSIALSALFENRPKPSLEERVEALEKQARGNWWKHYPDPLRGCR